MASMLERVMGRFARTDTDLNGQVALITGGGRGLGLLLARAFAVEGCRIAICSRDAGELAQGKRDLEQRGATVATVVCDITDRAQVNSLVGEVTRRFGAVDILVNNAGVIQVGPMSTMTLEDYEEAMDIMFWGALYPTLAVLPQMRERGAGRIVNITSIGGKISVPHLLPYSCAKFAAVGLSEGLRAELVRDGISVTTIVPGLMRTGSHENASFKGRSRAEYAWFSLGASLPIVSMDAERAAAQIVEAAKEGSAERILSLPATVAARVHGLFPGLTSDLLGVVNRILPRDDGGSTGRVQGRQAQAASHSAVLDALTSFGRSAARRFNQRP
jgi:NAD(P)-dependent dehydrogenase (short-subunit alcohol dehydrogenase family)